MIKPHNLFRMMTEFIFILLGGFLVWLGFSHGFLYAADLNPRTPAWLAVGVALIYWGARSWVKTSRAAQTTERIIARLGGASLVLVGLMMLALVGLEYRWMGFVLAAAGAVLVLRGFVAAVLSLRTD